MKKPSTIIIPTEAEIPALTDRLVEIKQQIETLSAEKKEIEARLEAAALLQQHEPLKDDKREGRKVTLNGSRYRLPVVFSSDLLIGSFKNDSPKHKELLRVLTEALLSEPEAKAMLKLFFEPPNTWETKFKDGQDFRAAAAEWLPDSAAPKFLAACVQKDKHGVRKSTTSFDYKAMEPITAEVAS